MTLEAYMAERKANRKQPKAKLSTTKPTTTVMATTKTASAAKPPKALGAKSSAVKAKAPVAKAAEIVAPVVAAAVAAPKAKAPAAKATQTRTKAKAAATAKPRGVKAVNKATAQAAEVVTPETTVAMVEPQTEAVVEVRIRHSNKLDKFSLHPANRHVVKSKVKAMVQKVLANNLLHLNPIIVDKQMRIIDGQHRYFAAKELGLTIYYIQGDVTAKEMLDLNASQKSLVLTDYLDSYVAQGFPEYMKVKDFTSKHKIVLYGAIGLLSGRNSQPNSELVNTFKEGLFKVKDLEHAERVLDVRDKMKDYAGDFYQHKNFTNAVAKVISTDGFDEARLDNRLKKNGYGQFHQAVTTDLYAKQILDVYNHGQPKSKHLVME